MGHGRGARNFWGSREKANVLRKFEDFAISGRGSKEKPPLPMRDGILTVAVLRLPFADAGGQAIFEMV